MSDLLTGLTGQPSEEQRVEIREWMLKSTFAFGKFVCGFSDLDPDFHGMMASWIQKPSRFKLGLAPRGHFKSTVWTLADKLRRITANPELQILILNEKEGNIIKWVGVMQDIVMSPIYRWLFPECVPDPTRVRWNALQLELKRRHAKPQPCIEGMGITSALASNHYDIIAPDDLVGEDAYHSSVVMEQAVDKRKRFDSLLLNPSVSEIHDVCTRWGVKDPANWVMENQPGVDCLKLSVWKSPGVPWFPKFFPVHILEEIRIKYGPVDWSLLYMNEAIGEGVSKFNPDLIRYWHSEIDPEGKEVFVLETPHGEKRVKREECYLFQIIDAGLSPESQDARTANVVAAVTPPTLTEPFDIVILEAKATHSTPHQVLEEANASYVKWNPLYASIETFGGHQAFFGWLVVTYPHMRVRELKKDFSRSAKQKRINGFWGSYPNQGRVYVNKNEHTDLMDELVIYPHGKTVDLLDAAGYLPTVWAPPDPKKPGAYRRPGVSEFDLSDYDSEEMMQKVMEGRSDFTGY